MLYLKQFTSIVLILGVFAGCSINFQSAPRKKAPLTIDSVSSHQEALLLIQATPTNFFVPAEDSDAAWERAHFFLRQYAGGSKVQSQQALERDVLIKESQSGFRYQITRQFEKGGAQFQVHCTPKDQGATPSDALLNAKNLARFIRDGELDLGSLK